MPVEGFDIVRVLLNPFAIDTNNPNPATLRIRNVVSPYLGTPLMILPHPTKPTFYVLTLDSNPPALVLIAINTAADGAMSIGRIYEDAPNIWGLSRLCNFSRSVFHLVCVLACVLVAYVTFAELHMAAIHPSGNYFYYMSSFFVSSSLFFLLFVSVSFSVD